MLRRHRADGTELGRKAGEYMAAGGLVPDELVISMLLDELRDARNGGLLLDGFPRTVAQAAALDRAGLAIDAVLLLEVPDGVVMERIAGRRADADAARDDDDTETAKRRLAVYHEQTRPLVAHYKDRGLLVTIDGARTPTEVSREIATALRASVR
jgi:adenylate kinase